jgi:S1-C subfamily serine protease
LDASGTIKIGDALTPNAKARAPVELFKLLAPSIYVVTANRSNGDELQGSAVAVSADILLTNCHVVANSESIIMTQKDAKIEASLISSDVNADRCVLKSNKHLTHNVPVRSYDELKIGERVYSIGAPAGLELTMSDGLLSGKRLLSGRRLVQTTAPISPGSSGGGLFDEAGNLIGITTFRLRDAENLNFAISAEDYLSR